MSKKNKKSSQINDYPSKSRSQDMNLDKRIKK